MSATCCGYNLDLLANKKLTGYLLSAPSLGARKYEQLGSLHYSTCA